MHRQGVITVNQTKVRLRRFCRTCLPTEARPSWSSDVLRKASRGMVAPVDQKVEKIKQKKAGVVTRRSWLDDGALRSARLFCDARKASFVPIDEECAWCMGRKRATG